jgi:hypothetical protein
MRTKRWRRTSETRTKLASAFKCRAVSKLKCFINSRLYIFYISTTSLSSGFGLALLKSELSSPVRLVGLATRL